MFAHLTLRRKDPQSQCPRAVSGLSLPVLGFPVGFSLGVRSEVVDELPTDLIRGLPELMVLRGGAVGGVMVRMSLSPFHSALTVAWYRASRGCLLGAGKASLRPAVPSGRKPRQ